jgi:methanogenic corrinoid protein MtbC1
LGQWWQADSVDFAHCTVGHSHLQDLLVEFSPQFLAQSSSYAAPAGHRALMMGQPNAQHALGLMMLAEFFRRDGWSVTSASKMGRFEALSTVANEAFDLVAISVSTQRELPALTKHIVQLRQRSLNPQVAIMVGGPMLAQDPHLAATLGADFSSGSADQALRDAADQVRMHRERQVTQARSRGVSRG